MISKTDMYSRINDHEFQRLWHVKKDLISVCKDCEYRYMCVDPRIPVLRDNGSWLYETECDYNPYIAKWKGEDGYLSLEHSGITSDNTQFNIDQDRLHQVLAIPE